MTDWKLFRLETPRQWEAGTVGERVLYFPCAGCDSRDPVIHGYTASESGFEKIQVLTRRGTSGYLLALWCGECFEEFCGAGGVRRRKA